jgi:pSer/pThr/pTyr-binding forkhead associated (FHA) protein
VQLAGTNRDKYISRRHCQLDFDSDSVTLQDLGSRCGTYLGGERIDMAVLPVGGCTTSSRCSNEREEFDQGSLLVIGGTTLRLDLVDCPPEDNSDREEPRCGPVGGAERVALSRRSRPFT